MTQSDPPIPTCAARRGPAAGALSILALALLLGLVRFWRLGEWSLWIDEVFTYTDWRSIDRGGLWNPLGYRVVGWTAELFGEPVDEASLRFLPALCGFLCIPLAWWAFRSWLGDFRAALVALLLALSPWHLFWSQNARFYTLALTVSLIGGGIALRGLFGGRIWLALIGTVVTAGAAAFHPTAVLLAGALCLAPWLVLLRTRELPAGFRRVAWAMGGLALLGGIGGSRWWWTMVANHLGAKGTGELSAGPVHLLLTCGYFFTPLLGAAAIVGTVWAWRRRDAPGIFAAGLCVAALVAVLSLSTFVLMTAQYAFYLLPWVMAVAVMPLESVRARPGGRGLAAAWVLLLALPAAADSVLYLTSRRGERPRWREAYQWIDERREPGDLILGMGYEIGEFYIGDRDADPRLPRVVSPLETWFPEGPRRWNRHARTIWVVIRPQWLVNLSPPDRLSLETWLVNDCRMVKRFPVLMDGRDLELLVYRRDGGAP